MLHLIKFIIYLGNIITIITKDVLQFENSIWLFNDLWIAVVESIVVCYLIYAKIGVASTIGVGMLLSILPVQSKYPILLSLNFNYIIIFCLNVFKTICM
ncbi:hypothetical protein NQ314_019658 [Rhamnusium bicolor]|uniref:Uncharacterized protein n=1 Tax=Rhamnusium bicolor TaxID=1586634 RepID=A0AAV8WN11_9CUCU|nr:hypothetical protein NQ314_019658 [Rhamnusium bicolor]